VLIAHEDPAALAQTERHLIDEVCGATGLAFALRGTMARCRFGSESVRGCPALGAEKPFFSRLGSNQALDRGRHGPQRSSGHWASRILVTRLKGWKSQKT
jgi:hypothetical protein